VRNDAKSTSCSTPSGPVTDPASNCGLAVVETEAEADMVALRDADPATTAGLVAEIYPMSVAIARERRSAEPSAHHPHHSRAQSVSYRAGRYSS
jgi:hypothetical protein